MKREDDCTRKRRFRLRHVLIRIKDPLARKVMQNEFTRSIGRRTKK